MHEASKDRVVAFIAHDQTAKMPEPGNRPLHNPAAAVTSQPASILMCCSPVVGASWDDRLDALLHELLAQGIAVIAPIQHQALGLAPWATGAVCTFDRNTVQTVREQFHFRRGRRVQVCSQRSTRAIDQNQALCAFAALGLADFRPPFFAGAKVPSAKHSSQRIFSWSFKSASKARHRFKSTPDASQCCKRRQQVLGLPYCLGKALHGAPVQRIHRMPSKQHRFGTRGRPPFGLGFSGGSSASMRAHCLSVTFPR
jgi:hypothetical protein